jgi:hypothetical protein
MGTGRPTGKSTIIKSTPPSVPSNPRKVRAFSDLCYTLQTTFRIDIPSGRPCAPHSMHQWIEGIQRRRTHAHAKPPLQSPRGPVMQAVAVLTKRVVQWRHPACEDSVMAMHRKSLSAEVEEWRAWTSSLISYLSCLPSFPSPWPFWHPS